VNRNLPLLVPKATPDPDAACWATVTQASPLRIRIDGESAALPFTPGSLVANLAVNDRVWIALATNADPSVKSRRVVIIGRSGGNQLPRNGITLRRNTTQSIPTAGSSVAIDWNVADFETPEMWTSGSTVTIPLPGMWAFTFQVEWASAVGSGRAFLSVEINAAPYRLPYNGQSETFVTMGFIQPLQAGETFVCKVLQSSGASINVTTARLHAYRIGI